MKNVYPIIVTPTESEFVVFVPDFNVGTQGFNLADAIEMARDAIGLVGISIEDKGEVLPTSTDISDLSKENEGDIIALVDIDFAEYRRKNDNRTVRRNVTLPSWLDYEAEKSGINVSAVLQSALKEKLNIAR